MIIKCQLCQAAIGAPTDLFVPIESDEGGRFYGPGLFCELCCDMVAHNRAEIAAGRRQPITPCGYLP